MEELRERLENNKWFSFVLALTIGIVMFTVMARLITRTTYKKSPAISLGASQVAETKFFNGTSWNSINNLEISMPDKATLKINLLKLTLESCILNNNTSIQPTGSFLDYTQFIDTFYSVPENASVPLYFAVRAADMAQKGAPQTNINGFVMLVKEKLSKAGI